MALHGAVVIHGRGKDVPAGGKVSFLHTAISDGERGTYQ